MKVKRSRRRRSRSYSSGGVMRNGRKSPERSVSRLRLLVLLFSVICACAVAGVIVLFIISFTTPFKEAEERNRANVQSEVYENNSGLPAYDDSYLLTLADKEHPLSESFELQLEEFEGIKIDSRVVPYLEALLTAAEKDGISLKLKSGYVSPKAQEKKYNKKINALIEEGLSKMKAEDGANRAVGAAYCNDAQTGMSVRFATDEDGKFRHTAAYRWLELNAQKYGFTLRYPSEKTAATGHNTSWSTYRFVGVDNAVKMRTLSMCLEEYAVYAGVYSD